MRACTTCTHPKRKQIEGELLAKGSSVRDIAKRYGLVAMSLTRHLRRHLKQSATVGRAYDLKAQLRRVERLQEKAEKQGRVQDALAASREARAIQSMMAADGSPTAPSDERSIAEQLRGITVEEAKRRIEELMPDVVKEIAANPALLRLSQFRFPHCSDEFREELKLKTVLYLEGQLEAVKRA